MPWHPNRRISPIFFDEKTFSWEHLPYHITAKEEDGIHSHVSRTCPLELRQLISADYFLINKEKNGTKGTRYCVTDEGDFVYFRIVRTARRGGLLWTHKIGYNIFSEEGSLVLKLDATLRSFFRRTVKRLTVNLLSSNGKTFVGEIRSEGTRGAVNCLDSAGRCVFTICPSLVIKNATLGYKCRKSYTLLQYQTTDGVPKDIGNLIYCCKSDNRRLITEGNPFKWKIELPKEIRPIDKMLILASVFLLK